LEMGKKLGIFVLYYSWSSRGLGKKAWLVE
jgi:hypothetical protein